MSISMFQPFAKAGGKKDMLRRPCSASRSNPPITWTYQGWVAEQRRFVRLNLSARQLLRR